MSDPIAWLRTPGAIRERSGHVLAAGDRGALRHFAIDRARLDAAADYVIATMRANYPTGEIPYHSRWRHFAVGGRDRWAALAATIAHPGADEVARIRFDLAVVSVLLDAGAGDAWRYVEPPTGAVLARSEGLAVASLDFFAAGACSADARQPLRADAAALANIRDALARTFQVSAANPLAGLDGRVALLQRLGRTIATKPMFGTPARIGNLFDHLAMRAEEGRLPAAAILRAVLEGFAEIWPGRIELAGVNLGDVGRHPAAGGAGLAAGFVPFHKLSQWLAYSLVEPLEEAGIDVTGLDRLTALAEYRNGGLLIDLGVLVPRHAGVLAEPHEGGSEVVVEWRALTVALIDEVADRIREKLGMSAAELPLPRILEGGTWSAGRTIAAKLRPGGGPPLRVISDGTLF
ncbi:MAG TPA: URC4/urg3 family protein [Geminicoccaceae bacterium]|nr:URC4/urg3 family protein [Geminicoccaceae bacterium]